ncbi:MAG TPA: site-2 protease family protein [Streptosporangiaceae bacterium]|nr:site-2 protease family protein [Streptosporangiaceae bacterium]
MSFLLGVVVFIVALLVSIMLHEAGHFLTAKKFGMKVTQFFVGFGQTVWSRRRGETEYGIKAIPAGGFVKITGMTEMDDVDEADEPRSFRRQPGWQRLIVLGAGSFMHFVLAFVLLFTVAAAIGLQAGGNSAKLGTVVSCVPANVNAQCSPSDPRSPAWRAGIRAGDTVLAIEGTPVHTWSEMGAAIRRQPAGKPITVAVERKGHRLTLHTTLVTVHGHAGSFLGVSPVSVIQRQGPLASAAYAATSFGTILKGSASAIADLPKAIPYLFAPNRGATAGGQVTSVVGAANDTGQVVASAVGWQFKVGVILLLIASLNIFVGAFNLLPLLPLDGGHIAIVIYERAKALVARLRGRPDPGPVDFRKLVPVSVGVFALLVAFGVLLIMADIVNPVQIQL